METIAHIRTLFDVIGEEEWAELRARMERREYAPGVTMISSGTLEPDFHVIIEGLATVTATNSHGARRELGTVGRGEPVGDMSLLTGEPASANVIAATPVVTYSVAQKQLPVLGELRAHLFEALAGLLAARLQNANARLMAEPNQNTYAISCSRSTLPALSRLPAEVARVTGARTLAVIIDPPPGGNGASPASDAVTVRHVAGEDVRDLARLLDRAGRDYGQILVFGEPDQLIHVEPACRASIQIVADDEQRPLNGHGTVVVTSPLPWVLPSLTTLSARLGGPVHAVIPAHSPPPGAPRDPIRKLARLITGRRVGVALGAGAAKGLAHMGVLRALDELGIEVDMISGCSIGAAIAAGWAAGYSVPELSDIAGRIAARAVRPTVPMHSFLSSRGIREELEELGPTRRFEELDIPLAICATDIFRRSAVTFTRGLVWPRILASMAIPGIYPALRGADSYLVDGAVLNPVPARQCRDMGAGVVVGIRLTGKATSPREALEVMPSRPYALDTIMRCFEIMQNHISEMSKHDADILIEVCLERGGLRDFGHAAEIAEEGYAAVMGSAAALTVALPYIEVTA